MRRCSGCRNEVMPPGRCEQDRHGGHHAWCCPAPLPPPEPYPGPPPLTGPPPGEVLARLDDMLTRLDGTPAPRRPWSRLLWRRKP